MFSVRLLLFGILIFVNLLLGSLSQADTPVFGPLQFNGKLNVTPQTFNLQISQAGLYRIEIINGKPYTPQLCNGTSLVVGKCWLENAKALALSISSRILSGKISVDGQVLVGTNELNAGSTKIVKTFTLSAASHLLALELQGLSNSFITFSVFGQGAVNQAPVARVKVSPSSGYVPLSVSFDGSQSSDDSGNIQSYFWDFGDGQTASGALASHTYSSNGNFIATLTVKDTANLASSASVTISAQFNNPPNAIYTTSTTNGFVPLLVLLDATASFDAEGPIVKYAWDFGDGQSAEGVQVSHSYVEAGIFTITLTVTDSLGAASSSQMQITSKVNTPPTAVAAASVTSGLAPLLITFDGSQSFDSEGLIANYFWDFGDGQSATGAVATHTYQQGGVFIAQLTVSDASGVTNSQSLNINVSSNQLPTSQFSLSNDSGVAPFLVVFDASPSSDSDGSIVEYAWDFGDGKTSSSNISHASHIYYSTGNYSAKLKVTDNQGGTTESQLGLSVLSEANLPPDPKTVAPSLAFQGIELVSNSLSFLYSGSNPIQSGTMPNSVDPKRVALLRGLVTTPDGDALSGVKIQILNQPSLGSTLTRLDGAFDFVVNAGGTVVLQYTRNGFFDVVREVPLNWQEMTVIDRVVMTPLDQNVTVLEVNSPQIQIAKGSVVLDQDGQRQGILLLPPQTSATMTFANGTSRALNSLSIRVTEFTVGESGLRAMPAPLPPSSGYTYAVDLSVDEAIVAGAKRVDFSQPVIYYLDSFVQTPPGIAIPLGFYNANLNHWEAEDDGLSLQIIGSNNGQAILSLDGTSSLTYQMKIDLQISNEELSTLSSLYPVGKIFWRTLLPHLSLWDLNFPFALAANANPPNNATPRDSSSLLPPGGPTLQCGSVIGVQNQVLGENIAIAGTPFHLVYRSDRVKSTPKSKAIDIELTGDLSQNAPLRGVSLNVSTAGQVFQDEVLNPTSFTKTTYFWDGLDGFGRAVFGARQSRIVTSYEYDSNYIWPVKDANSTAIKDRTFGQAIRTVGSFIQGNPSRRQVELQKTSYMSLEGRDSRVFGLGGWGLDQYHFFSPQTQKIYFGNGATSSFENSLVVDTFAGTGLNPQGTSPQQVGEDGPALNATFGDIRRVRSAPNGDVYILDAYGGRVRKVDYQTGIITSIVGGGTLPFSTGMLATDFAFVYPGKQEIAPSDITFDKNGTLYVSSSTSVFKVDQGRLYRVAGNGLLASNDPGLNGPALNASFSGITQIIFGPDDSLYVVDGGLSQSIKKVDTNGILKRVAGRNNGNSNSTEGIAIDVRLFSPFSIAISKSGVIYIAESNQPNIRKVTPDGMISVYYKSDFTGPRDLLVGRSADIDFTPDGSIVVISTGSGGSPCAIFKIGLDLSVSKVAGFEVCGFNGDGKAPTQTQFGNSKTISVHPDGSLLIGDNGNHRVRRIKSAFPAFSGGNLRVAAPDGQEFYIFSPQGLHLETHDTRTGALIYRFEYDTNYLLSKIFDRTGNVTEIIRSGNGQPTSIVSPYGIVTRLNLNNFGYLESVTNPLNEQHLMNYEGDTGLLLSFTEPKGNTTSFQYDDRGRLIQESRANGGFLSLFKTQLQGARDGYQVQMSTAEGATSSFVVEVVENGQISSQTKESSGAESTVVAKEGAETTQSNELVTTQSQTSGHPVFGMQSPVTQSSSIVLPSGLQSNSSRALTAQFTLINDLPIITSEVETVTLNGKVYSSNYDGNTKSQISTSPMGRQNLEVFDNFGRTIHSEASGLAGTDFFFDARGRLSSVSQTSGTAQRNSAYNYGANGYLQSLTNSLNQTVSFSRDALGRVLEQTLPDGRVVSFSYDKNGNLLTVTPPGRPIHQMAFDLMNLMSEYLPPSLSIPRVNTVYSYNRDNQLTLINRPDGELINYNYSPTRNLASITSSFGANTFSYSNVTGQLTLAHSYDNVNLSYQYDGNFLKSAAWSGGVSGLYQRIYNADLNLASETVGNQSIEFLYDLDGLLAKAGDEFLTRHPQTGLITDTTLDGVTESFTYNAFGELISQASNGLSSTYTRDDLGRITRKIENVLSGGNVQFDYSYDLAGRLIEVKKDGVVLNSYSYDSNSNRISKNSEISTVDMQDRLLTQGSLTFTYNANGEITSKTDTSSNQMTTYKYDVFGNLKTVILQDGTRIDYLVDAQNRRVGKKINGTLVQQFLYRDQLSPIAEFDGVGNLVSIFIYSSKPNSPDYIVKQGVKYKIVSDNLGSPRLVIRTLDNQIMQQMTYDEFGVILNDTNPGFQPFGFAGGIFEPSTGFVRFGARDYDPSTGRWLSKDPIGFDGGDTNLYSYAATDPVNFIDPSGLSSITYNRGAGTITVRDNNGNTVGTYPAGNNTAPSSNGPWPNGTYPYSYHTPHPESGPNGPYGSNGNFVFNVPGRPGMGIHSGRSGPNSNTMGCVRTTDDATNAINNLNNTDPLTSITVGD